jgi:aspartokinase
MLPSTTELTNSYINEHPHIKSCLKKGLVNYSSLARLISKDLKIEKKTSKEAILIAARRFHDKLKKELNFDKGVANLLKDSELEIKNKIAVFVIEKNVDYQSLERLQKEVKRENGLLYLLEGTSTYTIITQEKYSKIPGRHIFTNHNLALITIKSSADLENIPGVMSYLTSLFSENGVNIAELVSCWKDTMFVIDVKDVNKCMEFLKF